MDLHQALANHFKHYRRNEIGSLPLDLKPPSRDQGRHQLSLVMGDLGFTTGIEIGTRYGASARSWCKAMPNLNLICIDPYWGGEEHGSQSRQDRGYEKAKEAISGYNAEIIRKSSRDVVEQFEDESVDFVYIDGDHRFDAVVMDLVQYVPKVRKGGLVLVHDYFKFRTGGVVQAVDGYTHCHKIDPWYVTFDVSPTAFWQRGAERL